MTTTKPKHTQGPWEWKRIAGTDSRPLVNNGYYITRGSVRFTGGAQEQEANARLIAASPTAYEILSDLREWFTGTAKLDGSALIGSTDKTVRERIAAYFAAVEAI